MKQKNSTFEARCLCMSVERYNRQMKKSIYHDYRSIYQQYKHSYTANTFLQSPDSGPKSNFAIFSKTPHFWMNLLQGSWF